MSYLKALYGKIQRRAAVEHNLGFLKVSLQFLEFYVLSLARSLAKSRGEIQPFIGMFLTIIY